MGPRTQQLWQRPRLKGLIQLSWSFRTGTQFILMMNKMSNVVGMLKKVQEVVSHVIHITRPPSTRVLLCITVTGMYNSRIQTGGSLALPGTCQQVGAGLAAAPTGVNWPGASK